MLSLVVSSNVMSVAGICNSRKKTSPISGSSYRNPKHPLLKKNQLHTEGLIVSVFYDHIMINKTDQEARKMPESPKRVSALISLDIGIKYALKGIHKGLLEIDFILYIVTRSSASAGKILKAFVINPGPYPNAR
jgi:hypothetical protein